MKPPLRILALTSTSKGVAFALLEASQGLADWGLLHVRVADVGHALSRVLALAADHAADLVVVEDWSEPRSRRRDVARVFLVTLLSACEERALGTARASRAEARLRFTGRSTSSKFALAQAVATRFPELAHRLPPKRKAWMSEDPRFAIFEAVALASLAAGPDRS